MDELERQAMSASKHLGETQPLDDQILDGADKDFKGSLVAIRRSAVRARQLAEQTGTDSIVVRAGQLVRVPSRQKAP
jgi:hypothetical protein